MARGIIDSRTAQRLTDHADRVEAIVNFVNCLNTQSIQELPMRLARLSELAVHIPPRQQERLLAIEIGSALSPILKAPDSAQAQESLSKLWDDVDPFSSPAAGDDDDSDSGGAAKQLMRVAFDPLHPRMRDIDATENHKIKLCKGIILEDLLTRLALKKTSAPTIAMMFGKFQERCETAREQCDDVAEEMEDVCLTLRVIMACTRPCPRIRDINAVTHAHQKWQERSRDPVVDVYHTISKHPHTKELMKHILANSRQMVANLQALEKAKASFKPLRAPTASIPEYKQAIVSMFNELTRMRADMHVGFTNEAENLAVKELQHFSERMKKLSDDGCLTTQHASELRDCAKHAQSLWPEEQLIRSILSWCDAAAQDLNAGAKAALAAKLLHSCALPEGQFKHRELVSAVPELQNCRPATFKAGTDDHNLCRRALEFMADLAMTAACPLTLAEVANVVGALHGLMPAGEPTMQEYGAFGEVLAHLHDLKAKAAEVQLFIDNKMIGSIQPGTDDDNTVKSMMMASTLAAEKQKILIGDKLQRLRPLFEDAAEHVAAIRAAILQGSEETIKGKLATVSDFAGGKSGGVHWADGHDGDLEELLQLATDTCCKAQNDFGNIEVHDADVAAAFNTYEHFRGMFKEKVNIDIKDKVAQVRKVLMTTRYESLWATVILAVEKNYCEEPEKKGSRPSQKKCNDSKTIKWAASHASLTAKAADILRR